MSLSTLGAAAAAAPPACVAGSLAPAAAWPAGSLVGAEGLPLQVVRGVVLVRRQVQGRPPVVLEILGPGAVLGPEAAEPQTSLRAGPDLHLQPLPPGEAMAGLLRRIAALQDRAVITCHGSADQRLAWLLLRIAGPMRGPTLVTLPLGRAELAGYLGLTPETLSRALASLRRLAVLGRIEREQVEILRPDLLLALSRAPARRRREADAAMPRRAPGRG